jgi:hypothetical protein
MSACSSLGSWVRAALCDQKNMAEASGFRGHKRCITSTLVCWTAPSWGSQPPCCKDSQADYGETHMDINLFGSGSKQDAPWASIPWKPQKILKVYCRTPLNLEMICYMVLVLIQLLCLWVFFLVVLGLELRAYTLSHSISPFLWWVFSRQSVTNYLPKLGLNCNPPDSCVLSS